jgi:hypothetical protein
MVAVTALVVHVTATVVTLAVTVPVPAATVHVCPGLVGCVKTVTANAPLLAMEVLNVKAPFVVTVRLSAPLSCKITLDPLASPVRVPPMVNGPPVPPPPDPFGNELQPTTNTKIAIKCRIKKGFRAAFINYVFSLGSSPLKAPTEF